MTIKEIAKLAGVSISTVSKIVNGKDYNINPETRSRVLNIVKKYNYTPYGVAKNISNAKTFILGVLLRTASPSPSMINGILDVAQEHGYNILLLGSYNSADIELQHITALCKNKVDGVIWEPVGEDSFQNEHYFTELNIPVSFVDAPDSHPSYCIDYVQIGYALTQKLIDYKHTNISCLLKENSKRSQLILEGFKRCLFENQIPYNDKMALLVSDEEYVSKILTYGSTGIVSSYFSASLALYEQMHKLHYYIPSDISMVSVRGDSGDIISYPHISSIRIPYQDFGRYVCQHLIQKCEKTNLQEQDPLFAVDCVLDSEDSLEISYSSRLPKIIVVGSINTDVIFSVDFLPQAGKTTRILNSVTTLGGKGANQSVAAARLGREVCLIGQIGNDSDSTFIFDVLEKENISTQGIRRDRKTPTGKAYIYIEKNGEGTITVLSGANGSLSPKDISESKYLFKNAKFCLLSTELPINTIMEAASIAKAQGIENILKPVALKTISSKLLENIDIFIPNKKEAATLCPKYDTIEKQAEYFLNKGVRVVIITLGSAGCYLKTKDTEQYFPISNFVTVDTTGGADAFISTLAVYLSEGYSLEKSIVIATYAAGFCISRQGVMSSLADRYTLEMHIAKTEPELLQKQV